MLIGGLVCNLYIRHMCGITGYIDFKNRSSEGILTAMTDTLTHRGPDGSGIELILKNEVQIGLGHRRLSIIELTELGAQPMHYENLVITYNGEIYNFRELKKELSALGHQFTNDSDTEMILHAFKQWGRACVDRFIGMFAFCIYDQQNDLIFCVRDRAGVKPFFYYWHDNLFLFSSELKSFHKHPAFEKKLDHAAVSAFMQYGNVPTPHCIFEHCLKLKPGHYLTIDLKSRSIQTTRYWNVYDAYNRPKLNIDFQEAKSKTEEILQDACNYRMVSDVPVGVFLSGGYDSACVTALLQKDRSEKLKTFTVSVPDIGLNEAPYAKAVAQHLGTDHTEISCTSSEALELIKDLPYFFDEPFADSSAIPTTLVSKMARKEVTVALSADAGDEVFAGYNRYDYLIRYRAKLEKIPAFMRVAAAGIMEHVPSGKIPVLKNRYNFHNRYEKLKGILRNPTEQQIMLSLSQQFTDDQLKQVLLDPKNTLSTAYESNELQANFTSPLSYMMAIDYQTYLVDDILQKVDRSTMSVSLEGREPFLDHRVIEWAAQLPDNYKYHEGVKKYILKEIVHQYLPKEMMERPKMGFAIPIGEWLKNELRDLVEYYLSEERIKEQKLFNPEYVSSILRDFFHGKKEYETKIWYLLMFQMWYEQWMEN